MIRSLNRKTLIALFTSVFAAAAFAMAASPAQASTPNATDTTQVATSEDASNDVGIQTSADCVYYLRAVGYAVGPQRTQNCNTGANGSWSAYLFCYIGLVDGGVNEYHAENACKLAA